MWYWSPSLARRHFVIKFKSTCAQFCSFSFAHIYIPYVHIAGTRGDDLTFSSLSRALSVVHIISGLQLNPHYLTSTARLSWAHTAKQWNGTRWIHCIQFFGILLTFPPFFALKNKEMQHNNSLKGKQFVWRKAAAVAVTVMKLRMSGKEAGYISER